MSNTLDPTIKENWQYHDEYEFWYIPYPGTNEAQAEEGVRWRGFKPWEQSKAPEREAVTLTKSDHDEAVIAMSIRYAIAAGISDDVIAVVKPMSKALDALLEKFVITRRG